MLHYTISFLSRFKKHAEERIIPLKHLLILAILTLIFYHPSAAQDARNHFIERSRLNLDNTNAYIDLEDSIYAVVCTPFDLTIYGTFTDARVFDLHFYFPASEFTLLSVTAGSDPSLQILPHQILGDSLIIDGFFHPNFSGTTELFTLSIYPQATLNDSIAYIWFGVGQGLSGTPDAAQPIDFTGDTTVVVLDATPPLAPQELIITSLHNFNYSVADCVLLRWRPVTLDADGDSIFNPLYVIHFDDVIPGPNFNNDSVGWTSDTFFYHSFIFLSVTPGPEDTTSFTANAGMYEVRARKTWP